MKKTLVAFGSLILIAVILFIVTPLAIDLLFAQEQEEEEEQISAGMVTLQTLGDLSIMQGESEQEALIVINMTDKSISYSLRHAQANLEIEPQAGLITSGSEETISLHVDDLFPPGSTEIMVYLQAEAEGLIPRMETFNVSLQVIPGELELRSVGGDIQAYWKGEPAPPGVIVSYREPGSENQAWRTWGETPDLDHPTYLRPGYHVFEFIALYGAVESEPEMLEIYVEEETDPQ